MTVGELKKILAQYPDMTDIKIGYSYSDKYMRGDYEYSNEISIREDFSDVTLCKTDEDGQYYKSPVLVLGAI